MPELALDDVQRHALAGELERVRVAQLVRREAPPDAGAGAASRRNSVRTAAPDHGRPRVGPSMMQNSGPTGSSTRAVSHGRSCSQPHSSIPTSRRRPPLPWRTRIDPRRVVEVVLGERERLLDAQAGAPEHDDHRSHPPAVTVIGRVAHDRHDLLDRGRVGGVAHALVARRATGVIAGHASPASDAARPRRALTRRSWRPPRIGQQIRALPYTPTEAGLPLRCATERLGGSRAHGFGTIEPRPRARLGRLAGDV